MKELLQSCGGPPAGFFKIHGRRLVEGKEALLTWYDSLGVFTRIPSQLTQASRVLYKVTIGRLSTELQATGNVYRSDNCSYGQAILV